MNQSTSEFMLQCEAREWLARHRKKALEFGKHEARDWWNQTIADIEKRRGKKAADQLREAMNAESGKNRRQPTRGG
jgi:hypothetical protein